MTINDDDLALWLLAGRPCIHCGNPRFQKGYAHCKPCLVQGVNCVRVTKSLIPLCEKETLWRSYYRGAKAITWDLYP